MEILFSVTFTASVSMPALIVLELLANGSEQQMRLYTWHLDKMVLLLLNYLIFPQAILWKILQECCYATKRVAPAAIIIGQIGWWYLFRCIGFYVVDEDSTVWFNADILFAYFCVCGTFIIATLSGFGAVYGPFCNITTFLRAEPSSANVDEMESRIANTQTMVRDARATRRKKQEELLLEASDSPYNFVKAIYAVSSAVQAVRTRNQISRLDAEIETLETFTFEMQLELDDLIERKEHTVLAKTFGGKVRNCFGWFLTVCCVVKLFLSGRNIVLDRRSVHDPVERFLTVVFQDILGSGIVVADWTHPIAMIFVGYLTFANTRSFVTQVLISLRYFATQISNDCISLMVCVITGMYFSASSLMMRVYLPESYRQEVNTTLGFDDRHSFQMLFDKTFVLSAMFSIAAVVANRYYKSQKFRTF